MDLDKVVEGVKKLDFFELQALKTSIDHKLAERILQLVEDNLRKFDGLVEEAEMKHITLARACRILADKGLVIKLESAK